MAKDSTSDSLRCIVVTPEATVLDREATFIALPLFDGELGVAHNHSPMIGRLGYGELRVVAGDGTQRYYVDGGFVQVVGNVVSVLTNRAIPASQINAEAAGEQLAAALAQRASGEEELAIRDRNIRQARAQLRLAQRTA